MEKRQGDIAGENGLTWVRNSHIGSQNLVWIAIQCGLGYSQGSLVKESMLLRTTLEYNSWVARF